MKNNVFCYYNIAILISQNRFLLDLNNNQNNYQGHNVMCCDSKFVILFMVLIEIESDLDIGNIFV